MKLKLLHKGLVLVSIPLCFEILVFSYLINTQNHLEIEAQRINQNKKINDKVNLVFQDLFGILETLRPKGPFAQESSLVPKKAFTFAADIPKRFEELELLSQGEPELLHNIQQGKREANLAVGAMTGMKAKLRSAEVADFSQIVREASDSAETHLQKVIYLGIFDWASKNKVERELLRKEIWEKNRIILKCGLALSVLIGIGGAFLLSKYLVRRVSHLSENAVRMGQGKPLLPIQGGTDELAELEGNFHQAANLLEAAKRMRQEVTAMITHDLKTPLQAVLNFLEMLGRGIYGKLNETGTGLLSFALDACHHMARLIDNVLQLEKLRSGAIKLKTSQLELSSFLDKCIDSVQLLAMEKEISINWSRNDKVNTFVEADRFWLEQVVLNILSNALKFSPRCSSITIAVSEEPNKVIVRISDKGPGIPLEQQRLIFDPFHRMETSSSTPGTGLGLSVAKELVELNGGTISVESREGEGTTMVLALPIDTTTSVALDGAGTASDEKPEDLVDPAAGLNAISSDKPAFKLLHKALILICIPLLFEVTIFGMLLNLQTQVEQEASRIDHYRQVNDAANSILRDGMYVGFALRQRKRKEERYQTSESQYRLLFEDMHKNFKKLEKLVEGEDLENEVKRGEHGIELLGEKLTVQSSSWAVHERVISDLLSFMSYLAKRSATPSYDLRGEDLRAQTRLLLKIALVMSVLFSGLGVFWYSRHIVVRLKKLGENARLLAKGEPLLPAVQGGDEIAALDASFHIAAAEIEAAKRMRQEAAAMITHDLKTPLQSLNSFVEMLGEGDLGEVAENGKKGQASSERSIRRMEELINSVLQLEKLRSGQLKLQTTPLDLASVLDRCIAAIKILADRKQIVVKRDYGQIEANHLEGDAFWLEQVFVNIMSNAVKFSPENSAVSVTLRNGERQLEVLVADQGVGIPADQLNHVFERFQRADTATLIPGTGLGLPIAKELIDLHKGSITVESAVGKGSTFTVRLPSM